MKRRTTMVAVAGAIGILGLGSAGAASALSGTSDSNDFLVSRLVEKFNLKEADVQAVFDEERAARDAERQAQLTERLQNAVEDGDITAAQKTLIEKKTKELQAAREKQQDEIAAWAKENNIDTKYLISHGRMSGGDRFQSAVDDGDITAAQQKLIEAKQTELEDARDTQRDELEQWAEDNDIDERYLMGGMGMKGGHGMGGAGMGHRY